jgi:hypothetical protein
VIPFPESDHPGVVVGRPLLAIEFAHQRVPVPTSGAPATGLSIPRQARRAAGRMRACAQRAEMLTRSGLQVG